MKRIGALSWTVTAVIFAALPVAAEAADSSPPTIDLQARCRTSEAAMQQLILDPSQRPGAHFDSCMKAEQEAHAAIAKAWPDMPQSYKSFCIRRNDFSPSYIEWIACLEMMIDLRKQRASAGTPPEFVSRLCPKIKYGPDGSIREVNACSLRELASWRRDDR
jgi:hypothetical protein